MSPPPIRRAVAGVIGHVDHGKTALVGALTGTDTDRLAEEKRRGISIALGFAHLALPSGELDLIDVPGHERFVRTMVAGATGLDFVLLVVAANEGIKPQTREHLDIAGLLGITRAVVVVTKADLVPETEATAAGEAARTLARKAGLASGPAIATSARTGAGIAGLASALGALLDGLAPRDDDGIAFLPVDRAFSIAGAGTVVTGTLRRGRIASGDALAIMPDGGEVRVRALQIHGQTVEAASPGCRVAVNLRGVEREALPHGASLATPGSLSPSRWLSVRLRAVGGELRSGARLVLLIGTEEAEIRLRLLDRDAIAAGGTAIAQLHAAAPIAVPARERFILRDASPPATVAGGLVIDPDTARLRRHDAGVLARLHALADASPGAIVTDAVARAGGRGTTVARLARLAGLATDRVAALLDTGPVVRGRDGLVVSGASIAQAETALLDVLGRVARRPGAALDTGLSREALLRLLPALGPGVLDEALSRLVARRAARRIGGLVAIAQPERERDRADEEARIAGRLAETLRAGGLAPPDPAVLAPGPGERRLLDALVRQGIAVRTTDRVQKRDILFHRDAIEAARQKIRAMLSADAEGLKVGDLGSGLGVSRKYSVPLLEHLDAIRFTRRVGDRRTLFEPG